MSYVTLAQAKAHLLVIHDHDDVLIQECIDAAESYAATFMNRPAIEDNPLNPWKSNQGTIAQWSAPLQCRHYPQRYCESETVSSEPFDPVPKSVVQAVKLLLADYYENRTVGVQGTIFTQNPAAENLLWQQRIGHGV
jgi:hypothetical protein